MHGDAGTVAQPDPSQRTWTVGYDAGGLPVVKSRPGGVSVARTFDELGRLTVEAGRPGMGGDPAPAMR